MTSNPTPFTLCIAGPSGCGKTALVHGLHHHYGDQVCSLSADRYYHDHSHLSVAERAGLNYDTPSALDFDLMTDHIRALKQGQAIEAPCYDMTAHLRTDTTETIHPRPIVLVEGIMVLSVPSVREQGDLNVYIDTPVDVCLCRRLSRDCLERGRHVDSVIQQYVNTVRPMLYQHVIPSQRYADYSVEDGGPDALQALMDLISEHRPNVVA